MLTRRLPTVILAVLAAIPGLDHVRFSSEMPESIEESTMAWVTNEGYSYFISISSF